jgi:hypothetical protein
MRDFLFRRTALAILATGLFATPALAQSAGDWPQMDPFALAPAGDESLLFDVALMPSGYYQLDSNGHPIDGIRLAAWLNLASRSFVDGRLRFVISFRYDLDAGAILEKTNSFDTLITPNNYALLAAYLEYDVTHDLRLRAGRQFYVDLADYLAFDGLRVMWKLPIPLQVEVYGGVRTNVAITEGAVASSLYELDGVAQAELLGTQPVVGAAIRWVGNLMAREEGSIGFRQSWRYPTTGDELQVLAANPMNLPASAGLPPGAEVTAQELVATLARDFNYIYAAGGLAYDLGLLRVMRARASLVFPFSRFVPVPFLGRNRQLDFAVDYTRYQPSFAYDSIWNYFTMYPYDEYAAGAVLHGGPVRLEVHAYERAFYAAIYDRENNVIPFSPGYQYAAGGRVNTAWQTTRTDLFDGGLSYQSGFGDISKPGTNLGGYFLLDAGYRHRFELPVEAYARASLASWNDTLITTNDGTSFGLVGGATWHLPYGASVAVIVQEALTGAGPPVNGINTTLYISKVPRVFAVVDLTRWL